MTALDLFKMICIVGVSVCCTVIAFCAWGDHRKKFMRHSRRRIYRGWLRNRKKERSLSR